MNPRDTFDMEGSTFSVVPLLPLNHVVMIVLLQIPALIADVKDTVFSTYNGSLTTPACNEVVTWINFITPLKISKAQMQEFRMLKDSSGSELVDNFRPPQPLNGRKVIFYKN